MARTCDVPQALRASTAVVRNLHFSSVGQHASTGVLRSGAGIGAQRMRGAATARHGTRPEEIAR